MFRVSETKSGNVCLEISLAIESITLTNGMETHFLYLTPQNVHALADLLMQTSLRLTNPNAPIGKRLEL